MSVWDKDRIEKRRGEYIKNFKNFLVFDIETVKDAQMFEEIADEKERERDQNGEFLSIPFHKVVAVSYLLVKDGEVKKFISISSDDEALVLNEFWEGFREGHTIGKDQENNIGITYFPVLISVNGKDFDMPVLKVRSLMHINNLSKKSKFYISLYMNKFDKWENEYPQYTSKYTNFHIDIPIDIFGRKISLKNLCYMCSIPVKQEGDGSKVEDYYKNGNYGKIAKYCAEDVKSTAMLFSYINEYMLQNLYDFPSFIDIASVTPEIQV